MPKDGVYQFQPPRTDRSNNRTNTQGLPPALTQFRASFRYANIVAAGQTMPIPCSGTQFYLVTVTAPLKIRPAGGVFATYGQGQGLQLSEENAFDQLEVKNETSQPIVFDIFVGFQGFIDNTLIVPLDTNRVIAFPTYPTANAANQVNFVDRSASLITDINGNQWYALYREAIYISNIDGGVTYLLQKSGSVVANGPAVIAIFPLTSLRLPYSGNYTLSVGGGNINVIASEGYIAIPKTIS